ncbi:MAG: hypothetical protein JXR46_15320 [Calditrichaceae bacterium]|nr:hypothetical protein [Calditrichaceae bacterium]MBN2710413.1 hypothetical protein [Calditrichaceae bacterium]RQV94591.1 MAG: hypothetical protein EH224_10035 [Calditrichota bacterium]
MKETKKYLKETLGLEIDIEAINPAQQKNFPLFIRQLYGFYKAKLLGRDIILLKNKNEETATTDNLRKHAQMVEQALEKPVVFVFPFLQAYNRKRLIQKQVAFIVPGKQMFIPQLLIDFKEFGKFAPPKTGKLLPAAQCLLFYHLLKENLELLPLKAVAEKLNYTQATVTRAVQSLIHNELADKTGKNKEVRIQFKEQKYDLWKRALPVLQNPVKKVYNLGEMPREEILYHAAFTALTHYTNMSQDRKKYYAMAEKEFQKLKMNKKIQIVQTNEGEILLEVWKYAPGILAKNRIVDPLSLYLTLKGEKDERIEFELEKMIEKLW